MKDKIKYVSMFFLYLCFVLIIITIINARNKKDNEFNLMYHDALDTLKLKSFKDPIYNTYITLILWPIVFMMVTYLFKLDNENFDKLRTNALLGGIRAAFIPLFVLIFKQFMI